MSGRPRYVALVFPIPVAKAFTYSIPEHLQAQVAMGVRVKAPFRGRPKIGFVVDFPSEAPSNLRILSITEVLDEAPLVPPKVLELTRWIADYYGSSWGEALHMAVPAGVKAKRRGRRETFVSLVLSRGKVEEYRERLESKSPKAARLLQALLRLAPEEPVPLRPLLRELGMSAAPAQTLAKKGLVRLEKRTVEENPYLDFTLEEIPAVVDLTEAQQKALSAVVDQLEKGEFGVFLLHGVTGSGKTEVYVRSIEAALKLGGTALVLLPEIALTPQTVRRFRSVFGDRVAVLHSGLTDSQRYLQWRRIQRGEATVVVGPRSAVFAPLEKLRLVVVDEEHEASFKEHASPRYHGRDTAIMRAKLEGAAVLLGSATPSLVSYQNALQKKYTLLELPERVTRHSLPEVEVVDMRLECERAGRLVLFSELLKARLQETLERDCQAILLLNRRGFASHLVCRRCGYVFRCRHCDITLTYHKQWNRALCHYCGYEQVTPEECPACFFPVIRFLGMGTERVEEVLAQLFPDVAVARLDGDTLGKQLLSVLEGFQKGQIQILLGTQVIAKGLDFPRVTLVGVISADVGLHLPDFLATERTFQLLTQVAGRAGRGQEAGSVVIQTFMPDHYAIVAAAQQDYHLFFQKELEVRRKFHYPPFCRFVRVLLQHTDPQLAKEEGHELCKGLPPSLARHVVGPVPCPIAQMQGEYRFQLLGKFPSFAQARRFLHCLVPQVSKVKSRVSLDVDPMSML